MNDPQWTQDKAIAFEAASECITDLMAICSGAIADEEAGAQPSADRLASLRAERSALASERAALRLADHERIAFIRREYGTRVRVYRAEQQRRAA